MSYNSGIVNPISKKSRVSYRGPLGEGPALKKDHDFTKTEIKAGAMVLAALIVAFLLALAAINRPDILDSIWATLFGREETVRYAVKFEEAIGLDKNAEVRFGGAKAGKVIDLGLDPEERRIVAILEMPADVPVNTASRAHIGQATLTSQPHVEVTVGERGAPLIYDESQEVLVSITTYEELPVIESEAGGMFASINNIADDVRDLIGVESAKTQGAPISTFVDIVDNVNVTLEDSQDFLALTRDVVKMRNEDLGRILEDNINPILYHTEEMLASGHDSADLVKVWLEENDDRLSATVESARNVAADIEELTAELENYRQNVENILENTDGLTEESRQLLERNAPVIEDTLADLRAAMQFFVSFAEVIAENPAAVLRGQRESGRPTDEQGTLGREPDRD